MSISCQLMYNSLAEDLGLGTGNERLRRNFVRSVNKSLDELSLAADLVNRISHISSESGSISLDKEYEFIVEAGVIFHITRMGHKPSDPKIATEIFKDSAKNWANAKASYVAAEDNKLQATDTNSVIGLGYLG